jgi:hypothetical protein
MGDVIELHGQTIHPEENFELITDRGGCFGDYNAGCEYAGKKPN